MVLIQRLTDDQWTRTEEPENKPHIYGHLIFDKEAKIIYDGKKERIFNEWCCSNLQSVY